MQTSSALRNVIILWVLCQQTSSFAIARHKEYRRSGEVVSNKDGANAEPSCEELKAMWRFSKRQSRAAEITNEIPTYRDPFSYNVWEPLYARSRSMGGMRLRNRYRNLPVFGRVLQKPPVLRIQDLAERNRAFEEVARMYGTVERDTKPRRRVTAFRLSGGGHLTPVGLTPQSGSFQHLKELIRTEHARELQEQRQAEETAARNQALKELASNTHRSENNYQDFNNYGYDLTADREAEERQQQQESLPAHKTVLVFPNLLAPAARFSPDEARYIDDYVYLRDRPRNHRSMSMLQSNEYNNDMEGLAL